MAIIKARDLELEHALVGFRLPFELFSLEMKSPYCPKIKIKDEEYPKIPYVTFLKVINKFILIFYLNF